MAQSKFASAMAAQARDPKSRFLMIVAVGVAAVGIGVSYYTLNEGQQVQTGANLSATPEVQSIPGELGSPFYESILSDFNQREFQRALEEGRGFVPVLQGQLQIDTDLTLPLPPAPLPRVVESAPEEPDAPVLPARTAMAPPATPKPLPVPVVVAAPPPPMPQPLWIQADQGLASAMQSQIGGIVGGWRPQPSNSVVFYVPGNRPTGQTQPLNSAPQMGAAIANPNPPAPAEDEQVRLVKPGEMIFARLVTRAVSTKPGPILGEIVGGKLSGSRLIGTFSQNDDVMFLEFNTLVYPNGDTTNIDAAAVDPADGTTGLATSVDHFFFERFVVAGAAAFLDEFADQFSDTESSIIISVGGGGTTTQETSAEASFEESLVAGLGDAAEVVVDETERNRGKYSRPEVTIAQGTLFGLMFLQELVGPAPGSSVYKK